VLREACVWRAALAAPCRRRQKAEAASFITCAFACIYVYGARALTWCALWGTRRHSTYRYRDKYSDIADDNTTGNMTMKKKKKKIHNTQHGTQHLLHIYILNTVCDTWRRQNNTRHPRAHAHTRARARITPRFNNDDLLRADATTDEPTSSGACTAYI